MKKQKYLIEIITLLLYASALIVIMYYHEPWFDEAQAWLIARDATIKELFSSITHYEGHPPFWFLILMPFAKLGVPFEIGIKSVNFIIVTLAMGIFIFKAPFNRFIRCTIPFTYFFFYQYGIISRPYSLMMLGFVLSALTFKERNEKPFRFVAALSLICAASAYGMIIAAGISLVWLWEMVGKSFSCNKMKLFFKSKNFYALSLFFIFNILLLFCIYPYPDTYAINVVKEPKLEMLFYMFFIAPADATCSFGYGGSEFQFLFCIIISIIIVAAMLEVTGMAQKRALFIIPYVLFASFGGMVYFWYHHVGIITMFYMFLFWCCFDEIPKAIETQKITPPKHLYYIGYLLVYIMIGISIYWSISASINEISLNYGTGRETAEFIVDNKLDQKNILVAWREIENQDTGDNDQDYNSLLGIPALAYFDKNIFYNFNNKLDNKCYISHEIDTNGYYTKELIRNYYPDILLGTDDSAYTFGSEVNMDDFSLVKSVNGNTIWKSTTAEYRQFIYIRKDLLKNYPDLTPLNKKGFNEEEKIPDK
jgi:hypothetical protein